MPCCRPQVSFLIFNFLQLRNDFSPSSRNQHILLFLSCLWRGQDLLQICLWSRDASRAPLSSPGTPILLQIPSRNWNGGIYFIIYVVAHMFWTQLDLMRFPERRKGEQLFQEHTSFPIPHHPTIHTYAFCLHYNFYPSLKLSISIWINVFLQVSYIRGSILLPSRQAVPGIILSLNILWAVQVILQLFSSANLDSSHDVSRFEGYPLQWINISYAITTVPMVERNLSYLKLSFKTSQK